MGNQDEAEQPLKPRLEATEELNASFCGNTPGASPGRFP